MAQSSSAAVMACRRSRLFSEQRLSGWRSQLCFFDRFLPGPVTNLSCKSLYVRERFTRLSNARKIAERKSHKAMRDQTVSPRLRTIWHSRYVRIFIAASIFALACAASLWGAVGPVLPSDAPHRTAAVGLQVRIKSAGSQKSSMDAGDIAPNGSSMADSSGMLVLSL